MSTFNLAKKLKPATKAWRSFKYHLRSKLSNNPKFIKAIKTLRQHSKVVYKSIFPFIHQKFLAITKRTPPYSRRHHHHHHHRFHPSCSAIYMDELFQGPIPLLAETRKDKETMAESSRDISVNKSRPESPLETQNRAKIQIQEVDRKVSAEILKEDEKGLAAEKAKAKAGESSKSSDKWKIPLLPQFRGIDERAEEFIAKFRHDMKIEREQSIIEFEEMLKRSA